MTYRHRSSKSYLYQFIPSFLYGITDKKKVIFNGKAIKTDYIVNMAHELLVKYYFQKNDIIEKENKFPLWSILLKKRYGKYYNYYVDYLADKDFIRMVSDYYSGKKVREYTLNREHLTNIKRVKITDGVLLKKYDREYLDQSFLEISKSPIPIEIRRKLVDDLHSVRIDTSSCMKYLEDEKQNRRISYSKYWKNLMSIENIDDDNIFFKFDKYGRMHTNFTVLRREIRRRFVFINGEPTSEIDLPNSQPLFLATLMKRELNNKELMKDDITRYFDLVYNGLLYEEIMEKGGIEDREDAKTFMYKVLFGINGDKRSYNTAFRSIFPSVYSFIVNFKESRGDYRSLSHELQKLESEFIYNGVIKRIMETDDKIRLFTVHDSICVSESNKEVVRDIFYYYRNRLL